ncbi:protein NRT1/ PTR FAMILY 2.3-like isoform X2 [Triticum dicoccoides]|uniref:protein NRT1/ PTR FAMILY 2.3-like isoform X2 n=1 Tax=Triticum dicoccoides TaxID=85692 RepID=UPI00188E94AB|nr:protein NRT1/ PTR FAMILY 2.3-like isoform X2 [Triticum dicoccoides]
MDSSTNSKLKPVVGQEEAQEKPGRERGGWITLPFIAATMVGLGLAVNGTTSNLLVYLLKEYNVESIDAAQIANIARGSLNLVPVAGAVLADSYLGSFPVILAGAVINLLAFVLFTLTAAVPSLRPPHCTSPSTVGCQHGSPGQLVVLYAAIFLLAIGTGGTRFNIATMGADQFVSTREQDTFFNWYFVFLYGSFIVGDTAIVYIQDGVSWAVGFGVCLAASTFSLAMLLLGARYYRMPATKGSPYTDLARVVVAAVRKANIQVDTNGGVHYNVGDGVVVDSTSDGAPSKSLRFLNRATMITSASDNFGGASCPNAWRLCTVQQALVMDRSLGPHFNIPAGAISVCSLVAFIVATPVLDHAVFPLWHRITSTPASPLQRVGLGHVVNVVGLVAAALVERRRLGSMRAHPGAPMSVLWLMLPLSIVGAGEALHFPGNMAFYYLEFPKTLRSLATAMAPLLIAMGFYLSTVFVDVVRWVTVWLPGNIDQGRLDNVYWTLAVAATLNFGYFLVCVWRYKYHNRGTGVAM